MHEEIKRLIAAGRNIFITGSAGTGKSYTLEKLKEEFPDMILTASTGAAAVNISGTTIHSFAGIGIGDRPADKIAYSMAPQARVRIQQCNMLAIDEISMLSAETLDLINEVFKLLRHNKKAFGGIQLIVIGDFLQLPPVARENEEYHFAFEGQAWEEAEFQTVLLTKVYRQAEGIFLEALNRIRYGEAIEFSANGIIDEKAIRLFALNKYADNYNFEKLRAIKQPSRFFEAIDCGDPKGIAIIYRNCLAPKELFLKVGARVMLLINKDIDLGLINGSLGTITDIKGGAVCVKFDNGISMEYNQEIVARLVIDEEEIARRIQIPLRLAWAISIHKSQGMTLDRVHVDLQGVFEYGQTYVALSRVRTREGLSVVNLQPQMIKAHPKAVEFYKKLTGG